VLPQPEGLEPEGAQAEPRFLLLEASAGLVGWIQQGPAGPAWVAA
jgi:hypothetical protein